MLRLLLIEDDMTRIDLFQKWCPPDIRIVVASSPGKAIGILQRDRVYAGILLDHDLQEQTLTQTDRLISGSDIVKVIFRNISKDVPIPAHSMNISRAPIMVERLKAAGFNVTRIPMGMLTERDFLEWMEDVRDLWEIFED